MKTKKPIFGNWLLKNLKYVWVVAEKRDEIMKGALVFLAIFALLVVLTLGNTEIPPGKAIYNAVLPGTEVAAGYMVGGAVDAVTLIISVFNGVVYGFIAWLVYTLLFGRKKDRPQNINQTVNVNVDKGEKTTTTN
jgi:hypothetical protein